MQNPDKQKTEAHVTGSTPTQTPHPTSNPGTPSPDDHNQLYPQFCTRPQDSNNLGGISSFNDGLINAAGSSHVHHVNDVDDQQLFDDILNDQYFKNVELFVNEEVVKSGSHEGEISWRQDEEEEHHIIGIKEGDYFRALPSGYRFEPHDHELISDYLNRKIHNQHLPHHRIKLVNLYSYTPYDLTALYPETELGERKWYFFTHRDRKYQNGSRPNRAAGTGYWKATGKDKPVRENGKNTGPEIGYRKALVFYDGKSKEGIKTNWIMHEYRVAHPPVRVRTSQKDMRLDDHVLCKIIKKPERSRKNSKDGQSNSNDDSISNNSPENLTDSPLEEVDQNGLAETNSQAPHPLVGSYPLSNEYYTQNSVNNLADPQYNCYPAQNVFSNVGFNNAAEGNIQVPQQMGIYPSGYMPNAFTNPMQRNIQAPQPISKAIFPSSYMPNGMMNPMGRNVQAPTYVQPGQSLIKYERQITSFDASALVDYGMRSFDAFSSIDPNADCYFKDEN